MQNKMEILSRMAQTHIDSVKKKQEAVKGNNRVIVIFKWMDIHIMVKEVKVKNYSSKWDR